MIAAVMSSGPMNLSPGGLNVTSGRVARTEEADHGVSLCRRGVPDWRVFRLFVSNATAGVAGIAFASLLAILARISQAETQHKEIMARFIQATPRPPV